MPVLRIRLTSLVSRASGEFWFFVLFFFVAYVIVWVLDEVFLESTVNVKDFPMGHLIPAGYFDPQVGSGGLVVPSNNGNTNFVSDRQKTA